MLMMAFVNIGKRRPITIELLLSRSFPNISVSVFVKIIRLHNNGKLYNANKKIYMVFLNRKSMPYSLFPKE